MKTKFKRSNRILSLVLALVLVMGMVPMTALPVYAAETEVPDLTSYMPFSYEDGVTQRFKYGGYLYEVRFTNFISEFTPTLYGYQDDNIVAWRNTSNYITLYTASNRVNRVTLSQLPKSKDGILNCFAAGYYAVDKDKPVMIITCIQELVKIEQISISGIPDTLNVGSTEKITADITPSDASTKTLTWSTADPSIARVIPSMDGTGCDLIGCSPGPTRLIATAQDGSGVTAVCDVTVAYLPPPENLLEEFTVSNHAYYDYMGLTYWFAPGKEATIVAPDGYCISESADGPFYEKQVTCLPDPDIFVYLVRDYDYAMTGAIDLSKFLKWDTTAPTGKVQISPAGNFWTQLVNSVSFGMFFKEAQMATITAEDAESGVKSIQYYVADHDLGNAEALEATVGEKWSTYNNGFSLPLNGKYVVYAKITDNVGNVSYISTNGIVLYSDAESAATNLTTTYMAGEDMEISVELNGNTVKEVKRGNMALASTDYTVGDGKITLKSEYLDELAAGEYTITVSLNPQGETYVEDGYNAKPEDLTFSLTVNTRRVAVPAGDSASFVYDGSEQTYRIASSEWYTVTGNQQTAAGDYTVTVSLKDQYSMVWDDGTTGDKTYAFCIEKKTVDLSGVKWDYTGAFQYDGLTHGVAIDESTLPEGTSVSNYTGHSHTETGSRQAAASITYDDNHMGEATLLLDWEIVNDWTPAEYTVSGEGWLNQDFVITPAEGYQISTTNTANGEWKDSLVYSEETDDGSVTFYLKNETDGAISLGKTVAYKLDRTDPTGRVEFDERNGWETFLNFITFNLFFKDEVTLKVTAEDTLSGIASIAYVSSDAAKTLEEVEEIADWTEYNGSFGVTLEDSKQFVYFVRITDHAGNVTYLSTDGAKYDTTAPVISGVENGETYYVSKTVTVTDANLDAVTLNGEAVSVPFTLDNSTETEYSIVAVDKAGNITELTVTLKPLSSVADSLAGMTEDSVNSDDYADLEDVVNTIDDLLENETLTRGERDELAAAKTMAEELMAAVDDAQNAVVTDAINAVLETTEENVKLSDRENLETAVEDLEAALEDYGDNYTAEEVEIIETVIQRFEDALAVIENAEAAEEAAEALPADVEPDDLETAAKILAAKEAYDALSEHGKSLVAAEAVEKLNGLVAALTDYTILSGDGSSWTQGSDGTITVKANGAYSKFTGLEIDGKLVDPANYEAYSGSTIVVLKASYLQTLSKGEHTITFKYTDGSVSGTFKVAAAAAKPGNPNTPTTGDEAKLMLWAVLLVVSAAAAVVLIAGRKNWIYKPKYKK